MFCCRESANGSVATGQMIRSSVIATMLVLTKRAFSWKTTIRLASRELPQDLVARARMLSLDGRVPNVLLLANRQVVRSDWL
jgi:hypothetical protein